MHAFEKSVASYIELHNIYEPDGLVLVALSGGADSVALLCVLQSLGYKCRALHCNFQLRGEESTRDQHHAESVAAQLGVGCEVTSFDVAAYQQEHGGSVEMACRELRYKWFADKIEETGAQSVAVGHNATDNIETMFLNLLRGTSISGLTGMDPINRERRISRPLLERSREEITGYLRDKTIGYVTDSSNNENIYRRNVLRNVIFPEIRSHFPNFDSNILKTIGLLRENQAFYNQQISFEAARHTDSDGNINVARLATGPQSELVLYEALKGYGLNYTQACQIIAARNESGRIFPTSGRTFILDRGILRALDDRRDSSVSIDSITIKRIGRSEIDYNSCPDKAYFGMSIADKISRIKVRSWRTGDRIKPWGMKGSKKLSDIFSDAKIAADMKDRIACVELDGEVIWVAGLRNSRLYPVGQSDCSAIEMSLK